MLLSIMTLNNYSEGAVFEGFDVPLGMDRDLAINKICMECAEMTVVYPDLDIMKTAITMWAKENMPIWEKLYFTTTVEYNPIWNVDAKIIEDNSGDNSGDTTQSVKGYNSNSWAEHTKDNGSGDWSESRSMTRQGNIGVTSTQELLERERKVADFSVYKAIVDSFKKRFCLMVY